MCGGIVLAYSSAKIDGNLGRAHELYSHITYSLGRVSTYAFIGALSGLAGGVFAFRSEAKGVMLIIAGIVMVLVGLSLSGKINFLTSIEHSVSNQGWFKRSFASLLRSRSYYSFFLLGVLNGIIPCGFVYFFAIAAASSASPLDGAIIMAIFGLATIPAMLLLGSSFGMLKGSSLRAFFLKIASFVVFLFGIYTAIKGYYLIIDPDSINTPAIFGCSTC